MTEPKEDGCSFYVCGWITDGGSDHPFISAVKKVAPTLAKRWGDEIETGFKYDPDNRKPQTKFMPADDEDSHAQLLIVCKTPEELRICLNAMEEEHIWHPSVCAGTDGFPTENTANVTLRLYEHGTFTQTAAPKDTPPLPGLYAARKLIEDEISRLGGSNGY